MSGSPAIAGDGERLSFRSAGREIPISHNRNTSPDAAAILVLHGAGGVDAGNRYVGQLAKAVAEHGCHTFIMEYFARTATVYATEEIIWAHYEAWLTTISDALTFMIAQRRAVPGHIGIFGYSLGGYLAVAHASRDARVGAVVELAGGIDPAIAATVSRLPPLLIVHGRDDQRVPFRHAEELETFARRLGSPVETEYLSNERHILSPMAAIAALQRALRFFKKHLR